MDVVIERVMHTFRMVQDLTGDQDRDAREKVWRFLSLINNERPFSFVLCEETLYITLGELFGGFLIEANVPSSY